MDIKSIIKQKGLTMEDVAERMGISRVALSQTLSGNPTMSTLQRIADALECKVGEFFLDELEEKNFIVCPKCGARFELKE